MTPDANASRTRGEPAPGGPARQPGGAPDLQRAQDDGLLRDVLRGLQPGVRKLPPKHFYDAAGAALFDRITELEAYYPTRTELWILEAHVHEMAAAIGPGARVIEFGSGSGMKTRLLLRSLEEPAAYTPIDISCEQLGEFAASVRDEFPGLEVTPVCGDYMQTLVLPRPQRPATRTVGFFPGSTIGNFERLEAAAFLRRIARLCGPGGGLVLGTDMHKDIAVLERAYNDPEGVTAAFNLNLLARINRECGADFDMAQWQHRAHYDVDRHRIEMQLVCTDDCVVTVTANGKDHRFEFRSGEHITTEYSHKFTPESVRDLADQTGWQVERVWSDDAEWFAVWLLRVSERS
jgi:dimethylhistidine N-methyltransferase